MAELEIQQVLIDMRRYRMGLIQTADQLRFSYLAVIMGGKTILSYGSIPDSYQVSSHVPVRKRKVGGIRCEARSRGRSSPATLAF